MKKTEQKYQTYVQILKEELIPAMGCTACAQHSKENAYMELCRTYDEKERKEGRQQLIAVGVLFYCYFAAFLS